MNFPQEPDDNVRIDEEIERRLFDEPFLYQHDEIFHQTLWLMDYKEPDELPNQL